MSEPREAIAEALTGYLTTEQTKKLVDEILAITKRASAEFQCKKCKQRQMCWTDIPDAKAVAGALGDLLSQGFGRPVESSEKAEPIQFRRLTIMDDDEDLTNALRTVEENRRRLAAQRRENGALRAASDGGGEEQAASDPDLQSVDSGNDEQEVESGS